MRLASFLAALLVSGALAGCSFGRDEESVDVDKGRYRGGEGVAFVIKNDATESFNVTGRVVGVGNIELARFDERLEPGDAIERWFSTDGSGIYSARMSYTFSARTGSSSYGEDDITFRTDECAKVTRVEWSLVEVEGTVGSQLVERGCVDEEGGDWEPDDTTANASQNS